MLELSLSSPLWPMGPSLTWPQDNLINSHRLQLLPCSPGTLPAPDLKSAISPRTIWALGLHCFLFSTHTNSGKLIIKPFCVFSATWCILDIAPHNKLPTLEIENPKEGSPGGSAV